jgi:hypothetical protein
MKARTDELRHLYLLAKCDVTAAGYGDEIRWQKYLPHQDLSEQDILAEAAWVILNGGMRERVVRGLFPRITEAFCGWSSAALICSRRKSCVAQASKVFNHGGKLNAIVTFAHLVADLGHKKVLRNVHREGPDYLQKFPYLGPATSFHLAKNLGYDAAKPDRHLLRIAAVLKYSSPSALCTDIAAATGDSIAVVDLVLWRFATIKQEYLGFFGSMNNASAIAA